MHYVYILTNRMHGTLYTGVTGSLAMRIHQQRRGEGSGFVREHELFRLVCVLPFESASDAFTHEKRLKKWRRSWKIQLIERDNPDWRDLYEDILL
jgi:putative endonuclease